ALNSLEETPLSRLPQFLALAVNFLYFALMEGLWGASLGKRLLGLRVRKVSSPSSRPGLARTLPRTALFEGLLDLGLLAWVALWLLYAPPRASDAEWEQAAPFTYLLASLLPLVGMVVGIVALLAPMRARNGYRGVHEWLSDTRVVRLPRPEKRRRLAGQPIEWSVVQPEGMPETLSAFVVRGALRWDDRAKVLLGQDRGLGRRVWIWL